MLLVRRASRVVLGLAALAVAATRAEAQIPADVDPDFLAFLGRFETALDGMLNGDPTGWLAIVSDDPTLYTPYGGVRRGREAVLAQYRHAASRLLPSHAKAKVEWLQVAVSGDVAATVSLERSFTRPVDSDTTASEVTRATHIFRREHGEWRLAHRHMDHLSDAGTAPP